MKTTEPRHRQIGPPPNWDSACSCGALMRDSVSRTAAEALDAHMTHEAGQTLTDFLLERIAEDEEVAAMATMEGATTLGQYVPAYVTGARREGVVSSPARMLAECEAKRRIVERWEVAYLSLNYDEFDLWVHKAAGFTLGALALPYADHPDYREEWRP